MVTLSIKHDFSGVDRMLRDIPDRLQRRVIPAALNKTGAKAKAEMVRAITSEFNIKSDEVRGHLRLSKATRNVANWMTTLDPFASSRRGRSLNLIRFVEKSVSLAEARRRKKSGTLNQLQFQIKKVGGKKIINGAFISNKGRTVFVREGNTRLPIKALSTIDVRSMFNTRRINARVVNRIRQELPIEFERAIRAALSGNIR
jgi:hypothetical protein